MVKEKAAAKAKVKKVSAKTVKKEPEKVVEAAIEAPVEKTEVKSKSKDKELKYYEAVGRRKESVARVRLYIGGKNKAALIDGAKVDMGQKVINKKQFAEYFPLLSDQNKVLQPLKLTDNVDRFVLSVRIMGGGVKGQVDAVVLGIARALCLVDTEYRPIMRAEGLLTRDPRVRERRKVGMGGKARRQKSSPKR
jgi:small subunit ribosomal protein S9